MEIEFDILDLLQKLHTPIGDQVMCTITKLGNAGAIWIMLTLILLLIPKTRRCGAVLTVALIINTILCNGIIKPFVARPRPCDVNMAIQLLIPRPSDWSFPSGTYIRCVCIGIRTVFSCIQQYWCCGIGEPYGSKEGLEACVATGASDCVFQAVSVCALSD